MFQAPGVGCFHLANELGNFTVAAMTASGFASAKMRAFLPVLRLGSIWLVVALLAVARPCSAAETGAQSPRLTVAVLTFEDQTGNPEAAHWRYTIERLLAEGLAEAKTLRRVPAVFGYRQLKLKRGDPISPDKRARSANSSRHGV